MRCHIDDSVNGNDTSCTRLRPFLIFCTAVLVLFIYHAIILITFSDDLSLLSDDIDDDDDIALDKSIDISETSTFKDDKNKSINQSKYQKYHQ